MSIKKKMSKNVDKDKTSPQKTAFIDKQEIESLVFLLGFGKKSRMN